MKLDAEGYTRPLAEWTREELEREVSLLRARRFTFTVQGRAMIAVSNAEITDLIAFHGFTGRCIVSLAHFARGKPCPHCQGQVLIEEVNGE